MAIEISSVNPPSLLGHIFFRIAFMVGGSIYPVCFCGQFTGILRIGCRLAVLRFVRIRAHVNHAMRRGFNEVVVNSIAFVMKSHSVSEFFNVFLPNLVVPEGLRT